MENHHWKTAVERGIGGAQCSIVMASKSQGKSRGGTENQEADKEGRERESEDFRVSEVSVLGNEFPFILRQFLTVLVNDGPRPNYQGREVGLLGLMGPPIFFLYFF